MVIQIMTNTAWDVVHQSHKNIATWQTSMHLLAILTYLNRWAKYNARQRSQICTYPGIYCAHHSAHQLSICLAFHLCRKPSNFVRSKRQVPKINVQHRFQTSEVRWSHISGVAFSPFKLHIHASICSGAIIGRVPVCISGGSRTPSTTAQIQKHRCQYNRPDQQSQQAYKHNPDKVSCQIIRTTLE